MKKKGSVFLFGLAGALILAAGLGRANAYFTTYAEARGGVTVRLGSRTELIEEVSDWTKRVSVTSDSDSQPVYIRARAFCGSAYHLKYSDSSNLWRDGGDGYYYYQEILRGGETTSELNIEIENAPETAAAGDSFQVVVVYESTPVCYDEDGNPYEDWTASAVVMSEEENQGQEGGVR